MFGFLKKKEADNPFKLDEISLPKLSDSAPEEEPQVDPSAQNPFVVPQPMPEQANQSQFQMQTPQSLQPSFNQFSQQSQMGQMQQQQYPTMPQQFQAQPVSQASLSDEKISHMEQRIVLMEAKLQTIESKIDVMMQILYSEVSEDTKRKFRIEQSNSFDTPRKLHFQDY